MSKYEVTFSCGHTQEIQLYGKESERKNKISYYEREGLCKECYAKYKAEQLAKEPLTINVEINAYLDNDGDITADLWFTGNTMAHKDEIKALGYKWNGYEWRKTIKFDDRLIEGKKPLSIGTVSGYAYTENREIAIAKKAEYDAKKKKINEIERPVKPELIKGKRWNEKTYGRAGKYRIYTDGEEVYITDEQAEELKQYLNAKTEYNKKVEEIKNA